MTKSVPVCALTLLGNQAKVFSTQQQLHSPTTAPTENRPMMYKSGRLPGGAASAIDLGAAGRAAIGQLRGGQCDK